MSIEQLIANIISILIIIGGPIIPLLVLAIEIGHWHHNRPDPTETPNE